MKIENGIYLVLLNLIWMAGLALVIANGHGSPFRSSIAQTTLLITLVFLLNSVFLCCALIRPNLVMKFLFGLFHVATMIILICLLFIMAKEGFAPAQILMYLWALAIVYSWFRVGLNVIRLS